MNVRLYDGSVRCLAHFDASSYESETTDPCTYCDARGGTITLPVLMSNPETGDIIPGRQEGSDTLQVFQSLINATTSPESLWFGWQYQVLI